MLTHDELWTDLRALRALAQNLTISIDKLLARQEGGRPQTVDEETDDHLAYRDDRNPNGSLSQLGLRVMRRLFESGFETDEVSDRMTVSLIGVRKRFREFRQTGQLIHQFDR